MKIKYLNPLSKTKIINLLMCLLFIAAGRVLAVHMPLSSQCFESRFSCEPKINLVLDLCECITVINQDKDNFLNIALSKQTEYDKTNLFSAPPLLESCTFIGDSFPSCFLELITECQFDFFTPAAYQWFSASSMKSNLNIEFVRAQNLAYGFYP